MNVTVNCHYLIFNLFVVNFNLFTYVILNDLCKNWDAKHYRRIRYASGATKRIESFSSPHTSRKLYTYLAHSDAASRNEKSKSKTSYLSTNLMFLLSKHQVIDVFASLCGLATFVLTSVYGYVRSKQMRTTGKGDSKANK